MVHVVECSDMSRKSVKKTLRNTVVEYSVPTIKDRKTSLSWIISVFQSPLLKIKNIALDDLSRSGDEGNTSSTVSRITEKDLLKVCSEKGTDIISVTARYEEIPVTIGIDLRSYKPFLIVRNKEKVDIELLEELFKLK